MKSIEELNAVKAKTLEKITVREGQMRILVGLATCGIAAGARPVYDAFVEGVKKAGLEKKVTVEQTGCIGICQYEPVVEVYEYGKDKTTYVKMSAEKAAEIVEKHIKGGKQVVDYTIGAAKI